MKKITYRIPIILLLNFILLKNTEAQKYPSVGSIEGFTENKGQITDLNYHYNSAVKYLYCRPNFNVQLRQTGFSYDTYTDADKNKGPLKKEENIIPEKTSPDFIRHYHRIDVELIGSNTDAQLITDGKLEADFNYFTTGKKEGIINVHSYQKVTYKNIYPNIDLEFYASSTNSSYQYNPQTGRLAGVEYDFIVHPGGNVNAIQLEYRGADEMHLENNALVIKVTSGTFTENIPRSYIKNTGEKVEVHYRIAKEGDNVYSFDVPKRKNVNSDLVIDPTPTPNLVWGTYYGGIGPDLGSDIKLGANDTVYITGNTSSTTKIATAGAYKNTFNGNGPNIGGDAFVTKFTPDGKNLVSATYYGGVSDDYGSHIALDASNNVYITGYTSGTDIPITSGAYQTYNATVYAPYSSYTDVFIAKFSSDLKTLLWSTYFGAEGNENPTGIGLDGSNNVYIAGVTWSYSGALASPGAFSTSYLQSFIAKFNPSNTGVAQRVWSTYYGFGSYDYINAMTTDAAGNVYVTGQWAPGGYYSNFISTFNTSGANTWLYHLGSQGCVIVGNCIAVDANSNVYVGGYTCGGVPITAGAYQNSTFGGIWGGFITQLNPANTPSTQLLWATYCGGSANGYPSSIVVDVNGNVYTTGKTTSPNGIATNGSYQTAYTGGGNYNAFVEKFNPANTGTAQLVWGSYYGGAGNDVAYGIATDNHDNVFITGQTQSTSSIATASAYQTNYIATVSAYQTNPSSIYNAFVAKFGTSYLTFSVSPVACNGNNTGVVTVNPSGLVAPYTYLWNNGQTNQTISGLLAGTYTVTVTDAVNAVLTYSVGVSQPGMLAINISATPDICNQTNGTALANVGGGISPYMYSWNNGQSTHTITGLSAGSTFTLDVTDNNGCTSVGTVTITASPTLTVITSNNLSICPGNNSILSASGGTAYLWSTGATINNITVAPLVSTTYSVIISGGSCTSNAAITITAIPLPSITIAGNNSICKGNSTVLSASGGTKYLWSNGVTSNSISISPLSTTSYTVIVRNSLGCADSSNITVKVSPLPTISITNAQTVCADSPAILNASGGNLYTWNTGATGSSITVTSSVNSTYSVIAIDVNNCSNTANTMVFINSLPVVSACCNATITSGQSVTLSAGPLNATNGYNWSPNIGLNSTSVINATASPTTSTWYYLTITDMNGCQNNDSVKITVNPLCKDVFVPNAFSPNADGNNDVLYVETLNDCIKTMTFEIYDRWGTIIFSSIDPSFGWDGKFKNQNCDVGIFAYRLQSILTDGTSIDKKGNISLIK